MDMATHTSIRVADRALLANPADLEANLLSSAKALADQTSRIRAAERLRELADLIDPKE